MQFKIIRFQFLNFKFLVVVWISISTPIHQIVPRKPIAHRALLTVCAFGATLVKNAWMVRSLVPLTLMTARYIGTGSNAKVSIL